MPRFHRRRGGPRAGSCRRARCAPATTRKGGRQTLRKGASRAFYIKEGDPALPRSPDLQSPGRRPRHLPHAGPGRPVRGRASELRLAHPPKLPQPLQQLPGPLPLPGSPSPPNLSDDLIPQPFHPAAPEQLRTLSHDERQTLSPLFRRSPPPTTAFAVLPPRGPHPAAHPAGSFVSLGETQPPLQGAPNLPPTSRAGTFFLRRPSSAPPLPGSAPAPPRHMRLLRLGPMGRCLLKTSPNPAGAAGRPKRPASGARFAHRTTRTTAQPQTRHPKQTSPRRSRPAWRSKAFLPTPQPPHGTQPFKRRSPELSATAGHLAPGCSNPTSPRCAHLHITPEPPPRPLIPPRKRQKNGGQPRGRPPHHGLPYIPPRTSAGMLETAGPGSPHRAPLPGPPKGAPREKGPFPFRSPLAIFPRAPSPPSRSAPR